MPTKKILIFAASILVIVAVVVGVSYFRTSQEVPLDYTLETVKDGSFTGTLPPLDRAAVFSGDLPEEAKVLINDKIAKDQERLASIPYDGNTWMDLALLYHTANDFEGAKAVWEFIISVPPTNVTALGNLGRLHHFDLKDFPKAEEYFKKAIEGNPDRPEAYYDLFDLYRYSYKKDTTAATDILKAAAERFPTDPGIPAGLGVYYRDQGQKALARTYFEKALTLARAQGDLSLVQSFNSELANLP